MEIGLFKHHLKKKNPLFGGEGRGLVRISEENQGDGTAMITYRTAEALDPELLPEAIVRLRATRL